MTADELRALAARVEQATGPDRMLDAEIVWRTTTGIVGIERGPLNDGEGDYLFEWWPRRSWSASWLEVPLYTASLDAALTLVPKGWKWSLHSEDDQGRPTAYCVPNMGRLPWPSWVEDIHAATAALALTAAALRARAEEARDV